MVIDFSLPAYPLVIYAGNGKRVENSKISQLHIDGDFDFLVNVGFPLLCYFVFVPGKSVVTSNQHLAFRSGGSGDQTEYFGYTDYTAARWKNPGNPELAHFCWESLRNCEQKLYKNLFRRVETC